MRKINKTGANEPDSLRSYRCNPGDVNRSYENFRDGDDVRVALLGEQRNLCCYCMARISVSQMRIEHWYPQTKCEGTRDLEWDNLLAACSGSESAGKDYFHCDVAKGEKIVKISPLGSHPNRIVYKVNGRVSIDDPELQREIDDVLRLNIRTLCEARKAALEGAIKLLSMKNPNGNWSKQVINRLIDKIEGQPTDYCDYIVHFLKKKAK